MAVPAKKVELFAVHELRTAENFFSAAAPLGCKILVNPDQFCPDQSLGLIEASILTEMGDQGRITFYSQADRSSARTSLDQE
jgi:hypothetical protein